MLVQDWKSSFIFIFMSTHKKMQHSLELCLYETKFTWLDIKIHSGVDLGYIVYVIAVHSVVFCDLITCKQRLPNQSSSLSQSGTFRREG